MLPTLLFKLRPVVDSPTIYQVLADLVLVGHLMFVLFVILGGFGTLKWPSLTWLHLPALAWGILVEAMGWVCPLTTLENRLQLLAGGSGMGQDFIGHYLSLLIYPPGLSRQDQWGLAVGLIVLNLVAYGLRIRQHGRLTQQNGNRRRK